MRASELYELVGINRATYNTHRNSRNLPYELPQAKPGQKRRWVEYDLRHAVLLTAAMQSSSHGESWSSAAEYVKIASLMLSDDDWQEIQSGANFFAVKKLYRHSKGATWLEVSVGPADRVSADLDSCGDQGFVVAGMRLVNLGACARMISARLEDKG